MSGRGDHIKDEQRRGQRAHLLVGGVKFLLDQRKFAGKDIAVDVVEQVQGDEQQQRPLGGGEAGAGLVSYVDQNVLFSLSERC